MSYFLFALIDTPYNDQIKIILDINFNATLYKFLIALGLYLSNNNRKFCTMGMNVHIQNEFHLFVGIISVKGE